MKGHDTARAGALWTLTKEFRFEASHQLVGHDGKCARLHGHSWVLHVHLAGDRLVEHEGPKEGMLVDYADVKSVVQPLVDGYLDHHHLNETLGMERPTSERVAQWVWDRLMETVLRPHLAMVEISETCTSACSYMVDR